jgi:hypothetical protein
VLRKFKTACLRARLIIATACLQVLTSRDREGVGR